MSALPTTNHAPESSTTDLSDFMTRQRLSQSAIKGFFNIIDLWGIKDDEAMKLLGGVANGTFYKYKKNPDIVLDQDKLTRISYFIGIFKALHLLHGEALANQWISMPNKNGIFNGQTPLIYMIKGGIPAIRVVHQLLNARRGGM